jgi:endonuclease G
MNKENYQAAALRAVRRRIAAIQERDEELGSELEDKRREAEQEVFRTTEPEALRGPTASTPDLAFETIVLRKGRPVLAVSNDEPQLTFADAESEVWRQRLTDSRAILAPAIRAVGRIELEYNPRFDWVGTGWLVQPDVIVTNRHVAVEFGRRSGERFVFRSGLGGAAMRASMDFLEEFGREDTRSFPLVEILDIEDESGPDLAFLRVKGDGLAKEVPLCKTLAVEKQFVAVIGYPARDSRIPDQQLMDTTFGDIYDKKRLAPGQIIRSAPHDLEHDSSTSGGNSGSLVVDLSSGEALGIHFAGRFLEANFAVPAPVLAEQLHAVLRGDTRTRTSVPTAVPTSQQSPTVCQQTGSGSLTSVSCTVPITITVRVGTPTSQSAQVAAASTSEDEVDVPVTEGVPEDYADREGYQGDFLGIENELRIEMPEVIRGAHQIAEFEVNGKRESVLRYEHLSVVMNRKRRMCFYSAVNIDGKLSRRSTRTTWRMDPRIPKELQIMYECYGNSPKFSRGHMTRREDPVWGTPQSAAKGNSDSMHVTNVTPQMQSFNAPIWLGLEDYALQNARQDKMKISVFTGPVLLDGDPTRYGVEIPRSFWKVIAFIHDDTGQLTATGYSISQISQLPEEEFIFGGYETYQRSLSWIEKKVGISFGTLTGHDPLANEEEGLERSLTAFGEIRFR